jgi:L-fucose isomerase-like protein
MSEMTFAVFLGNRNFFPDYFLSNAREEIKAAAHRLGHKVLMMDPSLTRQGGVIDAEEGRKFAKFLEENRGKYQGIILSMPNFTDEFGAIAAFQDIDVPILIQAYPDELDKMSMKDRRDAFCGKLSLMCVFTQFKIPFTNFKPLTTVPGGETFRKHLDTFARTCRVVKGMKKMYVGIIGTRTTAFKAVRFDEITLQNHGISTETIDWLDVVIRINKMDPSMHEYKQKAKELKAYASWDLVPDNAFEKHVKLSIAIDQLIEEYHLDALAIRCWSELQQEFGISPCVLLSELNDRLIATASEVDGCNAVAMHALRLASENPAACLDWNNNYGEEENKCILFHCGAAPQGMLKARGQVTDHKMIANAMGDGCGYGCNIGRIKASPLTYSSAVTKGGKLIFYIGEGNFTDDYLPEDYFGSCGVAKVEGLQDKLQAIGYGGYRHHVSVTFGHVKDAVREAFVRYLGYEVEDL